MAALLDGKPQKVSATSAVRRAAGGRVPAVSINLEAGDTIEPAWNLTDIAPDTLLEGLLPDEASSRDRSPEPRSHHDPTRKRKGSPRRRSGHEPPDP